jgi:2-methylcitrate dehydratase PrpD
MSGAAERLLAHVLALDGPALPEAASEAALAFLFDTLAVGVAGRHAAGADAVHAVAQGWGGSLGAGCGLLGRPGQRATPPYAAFVNAFQIHSQEFDCVHEPAVAHPMATVVAALLAQAQRQAQAGEPCCGADFIAALVGGVDVVAALGTAATTKLKFFRPATCGIFGSTAALCRLRGLPLDLSVNAFGHALAFASGTMQAHLEGKPTLALQVAGASRSAVEAVDLAAAGLAAPVASIDGPFGYLRLFEDGFDLAPVWARLGQPHAVCELSWKPFPTGRAAHGGIVALQALRAQGLTAQNLASAELQAPPLIVRLVGRAAFAGMGTAHARLCLPYLAALTLTQGSVGLADFAPERLSDPALLALASRFSVHDNANPDPAAFGPALLRARLVDGRVMEQAVERQFGSPAWPLSAEQQQAKARACLAFGGLGGLPGMAERLAQAVQQLPQAADAAAALACVFGDEGPASAG